MAAGSAGRLVLMSVHPEFAEAILAGTKTVEFRKRPVAADVTHVVIYVTQPVSAVVGVFAVADQITASPNSLWTRFKQVAGISRRRFFEYYDGRTEGTGIQVEAVYPFAERLSLRDALGVHRPPQSYQYLRAHQATRALTLAAAT